jgi:hypothetical protein
MLSNINTGARSVPVASSPERMGYHSAEGRSAALERSEGRNDQPALLPRATHLPDPTRSLPPYAQ